MPLDTENMSSDVLAMMTTSHEATLLSTNASNEERAEAAWNLAQLAGRDQCKKRQKLLLESAKLGNQHGQVNYLLCCFRDSVAVAIDEKTHIEWLIASLTGDFVLKRLDTFPTSPLQKRLFHGFQRFFTKASTKNNATSMKDPGAGIKYRIAILHEAFVRDVLGGTYPPNHQILTSSNKWATIFSAKEMTFEKFRKGVGSLREVLGPEALHETAVYGTGEVVRDLVRTYKVDLETRACTGFHPGQATALQVAFLRHNMNTVHALIDLGADVLPLFSPQTLEAFLIEGDRTFLHFLNHLIPLMKSKHNAAKARETFNSVMLSSRAVQRTVIQSNWSL